MVDDNDWFPGYGKTIGPSGLKNPLIYQFNNKWPVSQELGLICRVLCHHLILSGFGWWLLRGGGGGGGGLESRKGPRFTSLIDTIMRLKKLCKPGFIQ